MSAFNSSGDIPRHVQLSEEEQEAYAHIADMRMSMGIWEIRLQEALATGDTAQCEMITDVAVEELDEAWPYNGELFMVAGRWWRPSIIDSHVEQSGQTESTHGILWKFGEEDVFDIVKSAGVAWRRVGESHQLGFAFLAETTSRKENFVSAEHIELVAVALASEASISHIPSFTREEGENRTLQVVEAMTLYDRLTTMYMTRPEFTRLSRARQLKLITGLVHSANEIIQSELMPLGIEIEATHYYQRTERSTPYGYVLRAAQNTEELLEVSGDIIGVGVLESGILIHKALRNDGDFIDRNAGLCVIVQTLGEASMSELYVPYRATTIAPPQLQEENDEKEEPTLF